MTPLVSLNALAWAIGVPLGRLHRIADNIEEHYDELRIVKGDKLRVLNVPRLELKEIQRRISRRILQVVELGEEVQGGVKGRSPASNARRHLAKRYVVGMDVKSYFPSVRDTVIYDMFRNELGFGRDVARLLTRLTTLNTRLPQGAPTSTAVANLLLARSVDEPTLESASRIDAAYSRFVDDVSLSGDEPRSLINDVAKRLSRKRLTIYREKVRSRKTNKFRIMPNWEPQLVTGLNVNAASGPSVPRTYRDQLRAAIFGLKVAASSVEMEALVRSIKGRIAHIKRYNPGSAARLARQLAAATTRTYMAEKSRQER